MVFGGKECSRERVAPWKGLDSTFCLSFVTRNVILAFQNLPFFISKVGEGNDTTYFSSLLW